MVFAFLDQRGLNYTNHVPRGAKVNGNYTMDTLGKFLKILKNKRAQMASQECFFHLDNVSIHIAAVVKD